MTNEEMDELLAVRALREPEPRTEAERLRALEDKARIRDLIMEYGYLCDARRWHDLLELYTDDIERTLGGTLSERVQGKPALLAKLEAPTLERKQAGDTAPPPLDRLLTLQFRHLMASDVVRLQGDGDEAVACVQYALVATADRGEPDRGVHEGSYIFRFRRVDGRWLFCEQRIFSDNARNPMFQRP
jgi:hypothetical protein